MKRHTHRGTKAMWQWRQRLEGCSCTPRCTKEGARKGSSLSESMALWFPWFQTPRSHNHGRTLLLSRLFSGMYFVTLFQYLSIQNKDTFIKIQYTKVDRAPLYDKPYRGTLWGAQKEIIAPNSRILHTQWKLLIINTKGCNPGNRWKNWDSMKRSDFLKSTGV